MSFMTDCSINVPLSKMKNKIPWVHTIVRCAAHAEDLKQNRLFTLLGFSYSHGHYMCFFL
jgi:hypothetical protein